VLGTYSPGGISVGRDRFVVDDTNFVVPTEHVLGLQKEKVHQNNAFVFIFSTFSHYFAPSIAQMHCPFYCPFYCTSNAFVFYCTIYLFILKKSAIEGAKW
jgi:hypothetical protein